MITAALDYAFVISVSDPSNMAGVVSGDPVEAMTTTVEARAVTEEEPGPTEPVTNFRNSPYLEPFNELDLPAAINVTLQDSTKIIPEYTSFFLSSAQEQDVEKLQITDTKGQFWAHFYGRKPRVWSYTGTMVSARNHDWPTLWDALYERYLRGTRCAELGARVQLTYANKAVYGWMISSSKALTSDNSHGVGLAFQVLVDTVELLQVESVLSDHYGVKDIDGVASLGDLQGLDAVSARVTQLDKGAGEVVDAILKGKAPAGTTTAPS
jgi:hypothetical protein